MTMREQIVEEARKWLDTPYHAQAAVLGSGVDCVNLVHEVLVAAGAQPRCVLPAYRARPDGTLMEKMEAELTRIPKQDADAGDVLVFSHPRMGPSHLAILTSKTTIIHAYMTNRKVVEHSLNAHWLSLVYAAYRADGVL